MKYTRDDDARIRAELMKIERESSPIPDQFGELPIDCFPSSKVRPKDRPIADLAQDPLFLAVENQQMERHPASRSWSPTPQAAVLLKAYRKQAIEAHNLRNQLRQHRSWTWTFGFASIVFFITTVGLLLIIGRI